MGGETEEDHEMGAVVRAAAAAMGSACARRRLPSALATALVLATTANAANVHLRWTPSDDPRVQGYYVYVRAAGQAYGTPHDVGLPTVRSDGSMASTVAGLSPAGTYFAAVSAYTTTRLESALSNELPIGTPPACVIDACASPTDCRVTPLADGTPCGPPSALRCGATCSAGVCSGLAERALAVDALRIRRSDDGWRVLVKGRFTSSGLFAPLRDGVSLTVLADDGVAVAAATLAPVDLDANPEGSVIRDARARTTTGPVEVRDFRARVREDWTLVKAELRVAPAPQPGLPAGASVVLEGGTLCLSAPALACSASPRALVCR